MLILGLASFFLVEKFMSIVGIASHSHGESKDNEELLPEGHTKNEANGENEFKKVLSDPN